MGLHKHDVLETIDMESNEVHLIDILLLGTSSTLLARY